MAKNVCFRATKVVKTPIKVNFQTKQGQQVSFKATKLVRKQEKVCFRANK